MVNKQKFIREFLFAKGIIDWQQLELARQIQQQTQERISVILKKINVNCDDSINDLIIEQLGLLVIEPVYLNQETEIFKVISPSFAHRFRAIPLKFSREILVLGFDDPLNFLSLEYFSKTLGYGLDAELIQKQKMDELLKKYYPKDEQPVLVSNQAKTAERTVVAEDEAPVIQLVNMLICDAYRKRASDIHIEPMYERLRIRYRIDGLLQEVQAPEKKLQASILSRVKLLAGMNIAEKRLPQDGRIRTAVDAREFDLRVSTLPAHYGESIVMRILDRRLMGLEELGFTDIQLEEFKNIINMPNGMVLVTGPTGSGKSTTLYSVLNNVNRSRKKILTVEDPVEYQIPGINQVQVKPNIGLSFARVLRSMLRQAPDIVMVGEIRDLETAQIAIQSALTGHLIFSTLHTNDAASAITRLVDMGIESYLVAATMQAILAQRLIRLLCPNCKEQYKPPKDEMKILGLDVSLKDTVIYRSRGCSRCAHTGYFGRSGIFEFLLVDDEIRQLAHNNIPSGEIRAKARARGMITLKEHAVKKVLSGLTTFQELVRVTQSDIV